MFRSKRLNTYKYSCELLGVPSHASKRRKKKAYHSLALQWHPDKNPHEDKELAEEAFDALKKAYKAVQERPVVSTERLKALHRRRGPVAESVAFLMNGAQGELSSSESEPECYDEIEWEVEAPPEVPPEVRSVHWEEIKLIAKAEGIVLPECHRQVIENMFMHRLGERKEEHKWNRVTGSVYFGHPPDHVYMEDSVYIDLFGNIASVYSDIEDVDIMNILDPDTKFTFASDENCACVYSTQLLKAMGSNTKLFVALILFIIDSKSHTVHRGLVETMKKDVLTLLTNNCMYISNYRGWLRDKTLRDIFNGMAHIVYSTSLWSFSLQKAKNMVFDFCRDKKYLRSVQKAFDKCKTPCGDIQQVTFSRVFKPNRSLRRCHTRVELRKTLMESIAALKIQTTPIAQKMRVVHTSGASMLLLLNDRVLKISKMYCKVVDELYGTFTDACLLGKNMYGIGARSVKSKGNSIQCQFASTSRDKKQLAYFKNNRLFVLIYKNFGTFAQSTKTDIKPSTSFRYVKMTGKVMSCYIDGEEKRISFQTGECIAYDRTVTEDRNTKTWNTECFAMLGVKDLTYSDIFYFNVDNKKLVYTLDAEKRKFVKGIIYGMVSKIVGGMHKASCIHEDFTDFDKIVYVGDDVLCEHGGDLMWATVNKPIKKYTHNVTQFGEFHNVEVRPSKVKKIPTSKVLTICYEGVVVKVKKMGYNKWKKTFTVCMEECGIYMRFEVPETQVLEANVEGFFEALKNKTKPSKLLKYMKKLSSLGNVTEKKIKQWERNEGYLTSYSAHVDPHRLQIHIDDVYGTTARDKVEKQEKEQQEIIAKIKAEFVKSGYIHENPQSEICFDF